MTKLNEVYKCEVCGNMVEVVHTGKGALVCCGKEMDLMHAKTEDQGKEKHVPVVEKKDEGIFVKVGSTSHPMEEKHYIEWIEVVMDGRTNRKYLKPGDKTEASFCCVSGEEIVVRAYCNIHGLWQTSI